MVTPACRWKTVHQLFYPIIFLVVPSSVLANAFRFSSVVAEAATIRVLVTSGWGTVEAAYMVYLHSHMGRLHILCMFSRVFEDDMVISRTD